MSITIQEAAEVQLGWIKCFKQIITDNPNILQTAFDLWHIQLPKNGIEEDKIPFCVAHLVYKALENMFNKIFTLNKGPNQREGI